MPSKSFVASVSTGIISVQEVCKMESKFTDKLDGVLVRLDNIKSSAIALSEALYFTGYEAEVFTGAANLIADNIEGAVKDLSSLAGEMVSA